MSACIEHTVRSWQSKVYVHSQPVLCSLLGQRCVCGSDRDGDSDVVKNKSKSNKGNLYHHAMA